MITSVLNPFFVAWWLTAGSAIILQEYLIGTFAVIAFSIGHWIADLGFLVTVYSSFSRGTEVISQPTNQSCAGAPRRKQRGMFAPPLQIPLKKTITINTLV
ncbi:LysE family transporter [Methanosarcina lacustris]|uniref:LysE family transporter n=1 Tax=Methanosarcina lacustris TaxID=170861 RepID=UPI001E508DDC|nr:LysE family transporter [Methanosarcina lacustris]